MHQFSLYASAFCSFKNLLFKYPELSQQLMLKASNLCVTYVSMGHLVFHMNISAED